MQNCPCPSAVAYSGFDIIAVASSLGGPSALGKILGSLPSNFPAAILVAQHVVPHCSSFLAENLGRLSPLPVTQAEEQGIIEPGRVYVARPNLHLLVGSDRRLRLRSGPKVKFCRPAAEPLFMSVAAVYRERALGLVLSGCNTDGAMGTQAIKWMGGRVLVQDPATARAHGMPRAAIATGLVDYVLPLERISAALVALVMAEGVAEYLRVGPAAA